jgi:NAD(P)-dependent dehydrogenase (short-subunit alcohol dehydrogenase family)
MSLTGKVGVVTGAGRGIGRELALALARAGAALVVNDAGVSVTGDPTDERPAEEVAARIREVGGRAVPNTESVARWQGARSMVEQAVGEYGRIDFVVNNAGILRDAIFHKMTEEDFDAVVAVHLKGSFAVARAAAETFRRQGSGAIVNMTSTSGLIGNYGQANYAAAKLGIVGLTRSIALDLRRFGVRANAVAPFAWTRITATLDAGDSPDRSDRVERLRRLRPEQVAPLVEYLVSDASREVTGQVFAVRGSEIVLFSLPRPVRTAFCEGGWTAGQIADAMERELQPAFAPLEVTSDVFPGEPRL